jgi:hypothetical protein
MKHFGAALAACACTVLAISLAIAAGSPQERGHVIATQGESPVAIAPPFRVLPQRYPVEHLAEALAEGIVVGHPLMPEFTFDPPEIDALLTYIESLSPSAGSAVRRR